MRLGLKNQMWNLATSIRGSIADLSRHYNVVIKRYNKREGLTISESYKLA